MHIHLDPVGGVAGDMFLAAILHAWPELKEPVTLAIRKAGLPSGWSINVFAGASGGITGTRVKVRGDEKNPSFSSGSFQDIRRNLTNSELESPVIDRSVDMFYRLAAAESEIHGQPIDEIHFHEIADWDSVADIVGAAAALHQIEPTGCSVGELPIGSGMVQTAHGRMPVPAPATTLLLRGYQMTDDGISGERVTPTGAAILKHLNASQNSRRPNGYLRKVGHGLGSKEFDGIPNMLRLLAFDVTHTGSSLRDKVGSICFEVDDQTPEDLSIALEKLRNSDNVIDVISYTVTGKKGRLGTSVRILCVPGALESVVDLCFLQTTTIGLRWKLENRSILQRENISIDGLGAKKVLRPGGLISIKADIDEIAKTNLNQIERTRKRRAVEGIEDEIDC